MNPWSSTLSNNCLVAVPILLTPSSFVALGIVDAPQQGPPNDVVTFPARVSDHVRGSRM